MPCRNVLLAGLFLAATAGLASAADLPTKEPASTAPIDPPFFIVNNNSISYSYEFTGTDPGVGQTPKNVLTFTHFDVWKYGTNLFNVDWLKATSSSTPTASGTQGYTEIYGFFRSTFGLNEIFNTKAFAIGPMTDVSPMVGADLNVDNSGLESAKRSIEAGIQFSFTAPYRGFINLTPTVYKEWQHDGYTALRGTNPSGNVDFNTTWGFEWLYVQPLGFLPPSIPLSYKFFGTIHGPKGSGEGAAAAPRTTEYYLQQNLSLDVGQMLGQRPNMVSLWAGYRYWVNKFGLNHDLVPYAIESTWLTGVTVAF
jgi:hypothetical protein